MENSNTRMNLMPENLRLQTLAEMEEIEAKESWKRLVFNICYFIAPKYWNKLYKQKQLLTQAMADGSIDANRIRNDRDWSEWNKYSIEQIKVIRNYLENQVFADANLNEIVEFVNEYIDPHMTKDELVANAKRNYKNYQESLKNQRTTQYYDNYSEPICNESLQNYSEEKDEVTEKLVKDYPQLKQIITEDSYIIKDFDKQLSDPKYKNTKVTIIGRNGEQIPCWLQLNQETKERVLTVKWGGKVIQRRPSEFRMKRSADNQLVFIAKAKR